MMPQMDKVTVFNQALAQFGDREYVKGSPAGRTVDLWWPTDRKSTRLNSSHIEESRMPSSA